MTPEERKEMERLVRLIQDEKDHGKFMQLIMQLNALLDGKERRLNGVKSPAPPKQRPPTSQNSNR
jgi:hypothetical protein